MKRSVNHTEMGLKLSKMTCQMALNIFVTRHARTLYEKMKTKYHMKIDWISGEFINMV